jgi:hypothetical protein
MNELRPYRERDGMNPLSKNLEIKKRFYRIYIWVNLEVAESWVADQKGVGSLEIWVCLKGEGNSRAINGYIVIKYLSKTVETPFKYLTTN